MSLRVLVVDDEPLARRGIIRRLEAHADIELVDEVGDGEAALASIHDYAPELVFLDVAMPGLNGLSTVEALPPNKRPLIAFLTAYDDFAVDAFKVQALDYLLKPIDDDRLAETLDRVRQAIAMRNAYDGRAGPSTHSAVEHAARFTVRSGYRTLVIAADDIDWIEATGDYCGLHVGDDVHLLREPLYRLARQLDPAQFMRIHRSTIVRLPRIAELRTLSNRDCLLRLADGTLLRASRTYTDALRTALRQG